MWALVVSMGDVSDTMWNLVAAALDMHALCGLLHLLRGTFIHYVGYYSLCVGYSNL